MELIQSIPSFLLVIIILVAVHEFGHFYVARLCGVKVLRFSLGFGKILWSRSDSKGTEFSISALPFGGYVKMLDEREGEVPAELLPQAFTRKSVWQRMAIVVAGPAANFILAIFLFWMLLLGGDKDLIPVVGKVEANSIAANGGLKVGQEILEVDSVLTPTAQMVGKQLIGRLGESGTLTFKVADAETKFQSEISLQLDNWLKNEKDPDPLKGLGIELAFPRLTVVGNVIAKGPADIAGFKVGDKIISVDQVKLNDWRDWYEYVHKRPGQLLSVNVERANETLNLQVTPESFIENGVSYWRVGLQSSPPSEALFRHYEYSVFGAFAEGVNKTFSTASFILVSVKKLILGEISTKNLSGPISIAKVAGSSVQNGLKSLIGLLALLSVSLGVFNLLPIPVLDGGHLVYLLAEAVKGKPVSERVQLVAFQAGLMVIICLSMLAMYNDIMRL